MSKQILWLAGAALLFAGAARADATEVQVQARSAIAQKESPAPSASSAAAESAGTTAAKVAEQELHPDAEPVYFSDGDCGSN